MDSDKRKTHFFEDINGRTLPGSTRTVNYFMQDYYPQIKENFQDAVFGVYDVLNDQWLNTPPDISKYRNPDKEFWAEMVYAEHVVREFTRIMERYIKAKQEGLHPDLISQFREEAVEYANNIEEARQFSYYRGWGVPRTTFQNIVFKMLQYSQYGEMFKKYLIEKTKQDNFLDYLDENFSAEKKANAIIKLQPTTKFFNKKIKEINLGSTKIEKTTDKIKNLDPEKLTKQKAQQDMLLETTKIQQQGLKNLNKTLKGING